MKAEYEYLLNWGRKLPAGRTVISMFGVRVAVNPGVFCPAPKLTYATALMIRELPQLKGARVLDMGTGCGILAIVCAIRGARSVLATDIDPRAVENAAENVNAHGLGRTIEIRAANLWQGIEEQFDFVLANLPIPYATPGWRRTRSSPRSLIPEAIEGFDRHVYPGGSLMFTYASFAGRDPFVKLLRASGRSWRSTKEASLGISWKLYHVSGRTVGT
jgi:16S rRNA G1207 methylase RsmC